MGGREGAITTVVPFGWTMNLVVHREHFTLAGSSSAGESFRTRLHVGQVQFAGRMAEYLAREKGIPKVGLPGGILR
jgi:hypothetical protein